MDFAKKIQNCITKQIVSDYCVIDNFINLVINVRKLLKSEVP